MSSDYAKPKSCCACILRQTARFTGDGEQNPEKRKVKEQAHSSGLQQYPSKAPVVLAFPRLFPPRPFLIFILQCLTAAILTSPFSSAIVWQGSGGFSWHSQSFPQTPDLWHIRRRFKHCVKARKEISEPLCQGGSFSCGVWFPFPLSSKHAHCLKTFAPGICNSSRHAFYLFSR